MVRCWVVQSVMRGTVLTQALTPTPHRTTHAAARRCSSVHQASGDPKETSLLVFPGLGNQFVGMGREVLKYGRARELYETASQLLGYDLLHLSQHGPQTQLDKTVHEQPATVVASLAAVERLREEQPHVLEGCVGAAGCGVGEITALVFADAINFEDALRLVQVRAEAMQRASQLHPGGMAVVTYASDGHLQYGCRVAREVCLREGVVEAQCEVAGVLTHRCKLLAGNTQALDFLEQNRSVFQISEFQRLPVSGAFHSSLMKCAARPVYECLGRLQVEEPRIPVFSNLDGQQYRSAGQVRQQLPLHLFSPIRWFETLKSLYDIPFVSGMHRTYECGPGTSLSNILHNHNFQAWQASSAVGV